MQYHTILANIFVSSILFGQTNQSGELPIGLTEEEKNNIHIIYEMGRDTDPPIAPVRNVAEFERMSGVLIRYPFGISVEIIRELSEDLIVYCLVSSAQQNSALNSMSSGNVNTNNVQLHNYAILHYTFICQKIMFTNYPRNTYGKRIFTTMYITFVQHIL